MSSTRIVQVADDPVVTLIDEDTGFAETVDMPAVEQEAAVDTVIEEQPEASSRRYFTV